MEVEGDLDETAGRGHRPIQPPPELDQRPRRGWVRPRRLPARRRARVIRGHVLVNGSFIACGLLLTIGAPLLRWLLPLWRVDDGA
jgi:hypothetical protein